MAARNVSDQCNSRIDSVKLTAKVKDTPCCGKLFFCHCVDVICHQKTAPADCKYVKVFPCGISLSSRCGTTEDNFVQRCDGFDPNVAVSDLVTVHPRVILPSSTAASHMSAWLIVSIAALAFAALGGLIFFFKKLCTPLPPDSTIIVGKSSVKKAASPKLAGKSKKSKSTKKNPVSSAAESKSTDGVR